MGAFCYVDDRSLLAPTKMYKLLHIGKEFSKEYNLTFNPAKSVLTIYTLGSFDPNISVVFNGISIPNLPCTTYFGPFGSILH